MSLTLSEQLAPNTPAAGKQAVYLKADGILYSKNAAGMEAPLFGVPAVTSVVGKVGDILVDKADVGLGLVDNTSDVNKPVSIPQANTFAGKGANSDITSLSGLTTALSIVQGGTGAVTANAAADALGAFRKGTILGTVSQTAGVPTGAIIERGSNANGEYVRWADGTQICTFGFTQVTTLSSSGFGTTSGTMYFNDFTWTYPAAFIVPPSAVSGGGGSFAGGFASLTTTSALHRTWHLSSGASSTLRATAVGRWF